MDRLRWIAFAVGLLGVFCLSLAAGGLVAHMGGVPSNSLVAAASPTPVTPTGSAPSSPPTTTAQPTASPAPTTAATPSQVPPTTAPTDSPAPTPALDPPTAEQFAADLAAAIRSGNDDFLVARLHPATTDRYGTQTCRRYIHRNVSGDAITWDVHSATGPAAWDYVTDGLTASIANAWMVSVTQAGATPPERELHFAPVDGTWRWFTDCGDPQ